MASRVDFSGIAYIYHLLETIVFGHALQRRRCAYLSEIAGAHRVLILGDGDGRFAAEYARLNHQSHLQMVDVSPGMQRIAQKRFLRQGLSSELMTWIIADAKSLSFDKDFDLIATHFFLDCFSDLELHWLVPRIASAMTAEGCWLVSEFQVPPEGFRRLLGTMLIRAMYSFFGLFTGLRSQCLPSYRTILQANDLRCVRRQTAAGGLLVSELWKAVPARMESERSSASASG